MILFHLLEIIFPLIFLLVLGMLGAVCVFLKDTVQWEGIVSASILHCSRTVMVR